MLKRPEWEVLDSSKLSDFSTCPRKFFFAHILGWSPDRPNQDAWFGEAWHSAREHMLLNGYEDVAGAYDKFLHKYRQRFDEDTDELYPAKNPAGALNALINFANYYRDDLEKNEVLFTEISGSVPINEDRVIYFRMDSIVRRKEDGRIFSWDHKTTKSFGRTWADQFALSWQSGTYTHCLYCMYEPDQVLGVEFCGTQFEYLTRSSSKRPAGHYASFQRVPAWKTKDQMQVWLWNISDLINHIEYELDRLQYCDEDDPVLYAFPMNPESCTKYWGCPYHDYCLSWPNPLQRCYEPPIGFIEKFWDPREIETTHKKELKWPTT